MKGRKNKSKIIAILCCALVFMGVGYAVLSQNLTINTTGNITGKWDIYIESILKNEEESTSGANSIRAEVDNSVTASFSAQLTSPGDEIVYDIKVVNGGNIDALLKNVNVTQNADSTLQSYLETNNKSISDYFIVSDTLEKNTDLNAGANTSFKVSVKYNPNAIDRPEGSLNVTIVLEYVQKGFYTPDSPGSDGSSTSDFTVDENGTVIGYNPEAVTNEEGYVVVPATTSTGEPITTIDSGSFVTKNAAMFSDYNEETDEELFGIVIYDEENFDNIISAIEATETASSADISSSLQKEINLLKLNGKVNAKVQKLLGKYSEVLGATFYKASELQQLGLSENADIQYIYIDPETGEMNGAMVLVEKLDLSQAHNLTTIEQYAFANSPLESIIFGESSSIETIGDGAFGECGLSGNIEIPASVTSIGEAAFGYNSIETLTFESGSNLKSIADEAFTSNAIKNKITLPSSVNYIGVGIFKNNQISEFDFTNLNNISEEMFYNNQFTGNLTFPSNVTTIGANAFFSNQISNLVVPNTITSMGSYAFKDNSITDLTIDRCSEAVCAKDTYGNQITNLTINSGEIPNKSFYENKINTLVLQNGVTTIGNESFRGNVISGELIIPSSVITIGHNSFSSSGTGIKNRINKLTFETGSQLQTIGGYAFNQNLISNKISIPSTVTSIGDYAFSANQITEFEYTTPISTVIPKGIFAGNKINQLTFPSTLTTIGDDAFMNNELTELTIPSNITTIGSGAFMSNLISQLTIPQTVTSLGSSAFADMPLTDLIIEKCNPTICTYEAYDYGNVYYNQITNLTINGGDIPESAFSYKKIYPGVMHGNLINLTLGQGVTSIGNYAFYSNKINGQLTIPASVTAIGNYAFGHNFINSLNLSEGLATIGDSTFEVNELRGELIIPASVTSIGQYAFSGGTFLSTDITITGNKLTILTFTSGSKIQSIGADAFYFDSDSNPTVNVNMTESEFANVSKGTNWYRGTPTINYK